MQNNVLKQVLLIDDDKTLLITIEAMLKKEYQVTAALGGQAGLKLLHEYPYAFDAIICDLNMPEIDGMQIYSEVVKQYPHLERKIIFMSGGVFTIPLEEFVTQIKNPILEKPFSMLELMQTLKKLWYNKK